jgi:hypothetical protein
MFRFGRLPELEERAVREEDLEDLPEILGHYRTRTSGSLKRKDKKGGNI